MNLILLRDEQTADGVFGVLTVYGKTETLRFQTMEDDWRDNAAGQSCIPAGEYVLRRTIFHKHNVEAFEVTGVPHRARILIHVANTEEDVEGCIGLGLHRGTVPVTRDEDTGAAHVLKRAVTSSRQALDQFMHAMAGIDVATLTVGWAIGLP
jgi:hypothetical protein